MKFGAERPFSNLNKTLGGKYSASAKSDFAAETVFH
jgi:hypothetical protein